jgi:hypothetical protein
MFTATTNLCDEGLSMACERDDEGRCGWVCVPPFTVMADEDASSSPNDAGL